MNLKLVLISFCIALGTQVSIAGETRSILACPGVFKTRVVESEHTQWNIYSNNPLRLTGAHILYFCDNEECTLDPDETRRLTDDQLSTVQVFRLADHPEAKHPVLVCEYGVHAQLSREIPAHQSQCSVTQHGRFYDAVDFEFEVVCK